MKIKLILTKISDSAQFTPQQKGILFEKLVKYYFQYDPLQRQSYSKVYTFKEFIQAKKLHNSDFKRDYQDRGIDLILVNPENTLCAVQCKFHQKTLRIKDVASFYATVRALNTNPRYKQQIQITETILFTKANHLSSNITKDYLNKNDRLFWKQHLIASTIAKWPTIEDLQKDQFKTPTFKTPKKLRPYQKEAVAKVINGFQNQDRGQLIMACGTGKTFTALKIAEAMAQKKSKTNFTLLFAMPSLSLVNQTMSEWYSNSDKTLNWKAMVVCSDKTIGKDYDTWQNEPEYLLIKPTTDPLTIAKQWKQIHEQQQRLVIFSTYHSLKQIQLAQQQDPTNCVLDLIIADEAHNTAGVKAKKSIFAIIHDDKNINSKKRLYMTATPKIYQGKEIAKSKSQNQEETAYDLIAMNDEKTFGKRFFEYDFKKAVEQNYLSNYKLIVGFWIKEKIDAKDKQKYDDINSKIDWDHFLTEMTIFKYALDHPETLEQNTTYSNPPPPQRIYQDDNTQHESNYHSLNPRFKTIIAFHPRIDQSKAFETVCEENEPNIIAKHIDGKTNGLDRSSKIEWFKEDSHDDDHIFKVLTNVRCLSEGVDIPALDAICFFNKKSGTKNRTKTSLIQAVGRVMRKDKDKKIGYVIVPVVLEKIKAKDVIFENDYRLTKSSYRNLIDIINSLAAHDERMRKALEEYKLSKREEYLLGLITKITPGPPPGPGNGNGVIKFNKKCEKAIYACIAKAQGRVKDWTDFQPSIKTYSQKVIHTINQAIKEQVQAQESIQQLHQDMQQVINVNITKDETIAMIAQHYLTLPVLKTIYKNHDFVQHNPISQVLTKAISQFDGSLHQLQQQDHSWDRFLNWLKLKSEKCETWIEKDQYVKDFCQQFLAIFDKKTSKKLGIMYTPDEVVDFMLVQTNFLLNKYFSLNFNSPGVNVLDLFAGTGTFLARLLNQKDLIEDQNVAQVYKNRIWAQEILPLPYYLTALNLQAIAIKRTPSKITAQDSFDNIILNDSLVLEKKQEKLHFSNEQLQQNNDKLKLLKNKKINVIIGNPPYGRSSQSNPSGVIKKNNYSELCTAWKKIVTSRDKTYQVNSLYRYAYLAIYIAYVQLKERQKSGIITFIIPNIFLKSRSGGGLRQWLSDKFHEIIVFDLHGDVGSAQFIKSKMAVEGQNIFGQASQTGIQIIFLIYQPNKTTKNKIQYLSINQLLTNQNKTTKNKLAILKKYADIGKSQELYQKMKHTSCDQQQKWFDHSDHLLITNNHYFYSLTKFFQKYTRGVITGRSAWCLNFNKQKLAKQLKATIAVYNKACQQDREYTDQTKWQKNINKDPAQIKWDSKLLKKAWQKKISNFQKDGTITRIYQSPFCLTNIYYSKLWCCSLYETEECFSFNYCVKEAVMGLVIPEQSHTQGHMDIFAIKNNLINVNFLIWGKFYPLYILSRQKENNSTSQHQCNINSAVIKKFAEHWAELHLDAEILPKKILSYVYGLLQSKVYQQQFTNHLLYEPPKICLIKDVDMCQQYINLGEQLIKLHTEWIKINRAQCHDTCCQVQIQIKPNKLSPQELYQLSIKGIRFPKKRDQNTGKLIKDQTMIIYNEYIEIKNIPHVVYQWRLNGQSVLKKFMNFYRFKKEKASKIENDPNDFIKEHGSTVLVDRIQQIIHISIQTQKLIKLLPAVDFNNQDYLCMIQ